MERTFKHPQIFADLLSLCQLYYPMHNNLPKPFRYAVGDRILSELTEFGILLEAISRQAARWQQWFETV